MDVITTFPTYVVTYFHAINWLYAGIIALVFGLITVRAPGVILMPIIAAIVYIAALAVIPPLLSHAAIVMPAFDKALLEKGIALYVIFLVADTIVFAVKSIIVKIIG